MEWRFAKSRQNIVECKNLEKESFKEMIAAMIVRALAPEWCDRGGLVTLVLVVASGLFVYVLFELLAT